jgi:uncharacterized protein
VTGAARDPDPGVTGQAPGQDRDAGREPGVDREPSREQEPSPGQGQGRPRDAGRERAPEQEPGPDQGGSREQEPGPDQGGSREHEAGPGQGGSRERSREQGRGRDRDQAGRPRNARPRDESGRPLPRGQAGAERIPDDLALPPAEALALAQRLLDTGRPFHAHEVLEASWKSAPAPERDLWQGLAQVAVGLTHVQRGNARGAAALLRRGGERVAAYSSAPPHGIATVEISRRAKELAALIERNGLAGLGPAPFRQPLTVASPL